MSAEVITRALLCGVAICSSGAALAADDAVPDADFLEYLGMWEESDQDWVMIDEMAVADNEERSDSESEGEESAEQEDES